MAGWQDIFSVLQNGVQAINKLRDTIGTVFPLLTATSTSVSPGTITFTSSQASVFGLVQTSSGGVYKIALYPST